MADKKTTAEVETFEKKGGYPAGSKPVSQIKPPPATMTKKVAPTTQVTVTQSR